MASPKAFSLRTVGAALGLGCGLVLVVGGPVHAQTPPETPKNPYTATPQVIQEGMAAFRANCAYCHGMDARGMRAPDLTGVFARGASEEGLYRLVRRGIPGTEMPPANVFLQEPDTWKVVMYLRTLAATPPTETPRGNAENGEKVFRARCASCHKVNGRGGVIGPDLSRIGISRTRTSLARQIRGGNEEIKPGYQPVTITTHEGRTIRGTRKNEDMMSVQIMDTAERLQGIVKSDVRTVSAVADDKKSLMPAYGLDQLNESDLDDLLRYLGTLKSAPTAAVTASGVIP
jgi:putative heme-binding domain-containing protein